jgi:hypothetical protein
MKISYSLDNYAWLPIMITVIFLILTPIWIVICYRNKYVKDVLIHGWYVEEIFKNISFHSFKVTSCCCNVYLKVNIK